MAFLDELGAKLTQTGQKTKKMANDLVDVAKLNTRTGELNKEIQECFTAMGEAYFKLHGEAPEEELGQFCTQIKGKQEELNVIRADIQRLKNIRVCSGCGHENPPDASFCAQCSTQLPPLAERPQPAQPEQVFCPSCGVQLPPGARFCTKCGARM